MKDLFHGTHLFLGVDGGQSGTTALLGDAAGRVVGVGRAGPCNHPGSSGAGENFQSAIRDCVQAAFDTAGETPRLVEFACFGLSGGPEGKEALIREVAEVATLSLRTDAAIALSGAFEGAPGVIAIAGTGSIAFGKNAEGRTARSGGWGYAFGDEGGAFDLVRQAVRAALRQEEGWGPKTSLRGLLISATGARDANDLLHQFYSEEFSRARVASFANLIEQAAEDGDTVARDILHGAAQDLAMFVAAVRRQLFRDDETARVSYSGGVFQNRLVRQRFQMLAELSGGNAVAAPLHGPTAGALMEAYRLAGLDLMPRDAPGHL